jgi:hypothetical protein
MHDPKKFSLVRSELASIAKATPRPPRGMPTVEAFVRVRKATPMGPATWRTSLGELCDSMKNALGAETPDDAAISVAFEKLIAGYNEALGFVGSSISPTALAAIARPTTPGDVQTKARTAKALVDALRSKKPASPPWPDDVAASAQTKKAAGKLRSRTWSP